MDLKHKWLDGWILDPELLDPKKGSNFYWLDEHQADPGAYQRITDVALHIGKRSTGFFFRVHIYPQLGINTWEDWVKRINRGCVFDDCGFRYGVEWFCSFVEVAFSRPFDFSKFPLHWLKRLANGEVVYDFRYHLLRPRIDPSKPLALNEGNGPWTHSAEDFS